MSQRSMNIALRAGVMAALGLVGASLSGCSVIAFGAATVQAAREQSNVTVEADYTGLDGHSFALLVVADRVTQVEYPVVVPRLTQLLNERLKEETQATGYIPPRDLLAYTFDHPGWVARPLGELAGDLGVDRLVLVELQEYRLYEPGNRYEWDGTVLASVGVIEADSFAPDEFVYTKTIRVSYPDPESSYTTEEANMSEEMVTTILESRFINRVTWLFYEHKERYSIEY